MVTSPDRRDAVPDALLAWMGGLADPTRLRILRVLEAEELPVLDLCEILRLPQSTVSRHLKVLASQGWLENRREGTASLYRLSRRVEPGARRLWKLARAEIDRWPAVERDALRLERRLEARRSDAQQFFAGAAAQWNRVRLEAYGQQFEYALLRAMISPAWTIADLGCGTGSFTLELARSGAHVIGIDQSAAMLRVARRSTEPYDNVELHQARLEEVPIADASCDLAVLVLVLSYVAEIDPVLSEAHRILKPAGRLLVMDAYPHGDESFRRRLGQARPGLDPADLTARLEKRGVQRIGVAGPIVGRLHRSGPDLFLLQGTRPRGDNP